MSSENWKLEKDLCRCCHSEGSFKNLAEPFKITDLPEIYADMLKECYDIDMAPVPGMLSAVTYTICEVCVMRLRDASEFKKQVLSCEERFKDMYNRNVIKAAGIIDVEIEVKQEIPDSEPDDDFKEDLCQDAKDDEDYDESMDLKLSEEDDKPLQEEVRKKKKYKTRTAVKSATVKSATVKSATVKSATVKSSSVKSKKKTKRKNLKQESADTENDTEIKQGRVVAPKFRLNDEDYKKIGDLYHCARCDKTYEKFNTLKFHMKTKHYKIPRYKCSICMKEFMTPAPLTVHKLEVHNVDDRFSCRACNKIFNTKVQLRKHINNFHMLGERYKCEFCEYESFSFEGMYKHKFKHKTVKDYHCKFCRKSFLRKTTLDLHERIHTGDRRKVCTVCGQAFVQKASLNYHMTKYHPEVNF